MKPTKTKEFFKLEKTRLPVYQAPAKSVIDPGEFIPLVDGKITAGGKVKLVRRADLVPQRAKQALLAGGFNFGNRLLDIFSPVYGTYYPTGNAYFLFDHSLLAYTAQELWIMELLANSGFEQELAFRIDPMGLGNYLKIPLGQTSDVSTSSCILSMKVNNNPEFNLNLINRSFQYFDMLLSGGPSSYDVEFALRFAPNNRKRALCSILQVELYNTIRVFPTGVLQA